MALNSRKSIDSRWTRHHTPVAAGFMLATVVVRRKLPTDGAIQYDPRKTDGYVGGTFLEVLGETKARVQPFGIIGDMVVGQDTTSRRLMRVQIERVDTTINVDDHILVVDCPDYPELTNFTLDVRGVITSSNAWLTDIVAEANTKAN